MDENLTAVVEKHGDWYVAYFEELPGVNTQGRTEEEARSNLQDALQEFLATGSRRTKRQPGQGGS